MKLYYYQGPHPNFGDDLNTWMWSKLLPNVWTQSEEKIFLGIGSIIFDFFPKSAQKIVFGAGYGGYTPLPAIDHTWKFYFVRGKQTAKAVNVDPSLGIGDAAILLRSCALVRPAKKYPVSFMPHWESVADGRWQEVCDVAGFNYIDPTGSVEATLEQILSSELVITEAMHGAIVSDALRVPWIALTPTQERHHMKWNDWASALDLQLHPHVHAPSSMMEWALKKAGNDMRMVSRIHRRGKVLRHVLPSVFVHQAAQRLIEISKQPATLSRDSKIESAHQQMEEKLDLLKRDLANA
jgi:succinoglycan biosynthesis protein ExoV